MTAKAAQITEARQTVDFIDQAIATVARSFIAKGAEPKRAVQVATDALFDRIGKEPPNLLAKYLRAIEILNAA